MGWRILSLLIGYLTGCFLTAEVVTRVVAGKSVRVIGSGNPGMANVMTELGKKAGFVVLAGDAIKTFAGLLLAWLAAGSRIGSLAVLWSGLGSILGHDFPFWCRFRGGKGVTSTCVVVVAYLPLWGIYSAVMGGIVTVLTGFLPLGAPLIPLFAVPAAFLQKGPEGGLVMVLIVILMISRHYQGLQRIWDGAEERKFRKR